MRFIYLFLLIGLVGCATSTGQSNSDEMKEEQEFQEMMQKIQTLNQTSQLLFMQVKIRQPHIGFQLVRQLKTTRN